MNDHISDMDTGHALMIASLTGDVRRVMQSALMAIDGVAFQFGETPGEVIERISSMLDRREAEFPWPEVREQFADLLMDAFAPQLSAEVDHFLAEETAKDQPIPAPFDQDGGPDA